MAPLPPNWALGAGNAVTLTFNGLDHAINNLSEHIIGSFHSIVANMIVNGYAGLFGQVGSADLNSNVSHPGQ